MKNNKGITLVAVVITIIVLTILAGITIGSISDKKGTLKTTSDEMLLYELNEIQQAVLELNIKYKQTGAQSYFEGTKITKEEADVYLQEIAVASGKTLTLKLSDAEDSTSDDKSYYLLIKKDLNHMGLANSQDEFVVNYYTGEVYNITTKVTFDERPLYVDVQN